MNPGHAAPLEANGSGTRLWNRYRLSRAGEHGASCECLEDPENDGDQPSGLLVSFR